MQSAKHLYYISSKKYGIWSFEIMDTEGEWESWQKEYDIKGEEGAKKE